MQVVGGCPHDCPDTCAWTATVESGRVTQVRGVRDHPVTRGHLCQKVHRYEERVYHPDRLLRPLLRTGPKGTMSFREATWDEARAAVRDGLSRVVAEAGPATVLPFSYMGTQGVLQGSSMDGRFFHALGAADLERTICYGAGAAAWSLVYPGWVPPDIEDVPFAEVVVAWGANMTDTHLHLWPFLLEARKRGGTVVVVDPFRTPTARAADLHLQLRPGTDGALALAMIDLMFREGLADEEFVSERCDGVEALRVSAAEWPVERAARVTGLTPDQIVTFARLFGRARPGFIKTGPGAQRHASAGEAFRAVLALPAVTGAWRHRGGGAHVHSAGVFPRPPAMTRPDLRVREAPTVNMVQLGAALEGRDVGALVVYNANPAVVCPDTHAVRRGLSRDDLFTVVLELMPTETVAYADVVLPATTQLEHLDVMWSWGHQYVTLNRPAIAPLGESKPNTEIFRLLAEDMGLDDQALRDSDEELLATYLSFLHEDVRVRLLERGWAKVTAVTPPHARVALASAVADRPEVLLPPQAADPVEGDGLVVLTPKAREFLNSSLVPHQRLRRAAGRPVVLLSPPDADAAGVLDGHLVRLRNGQGAMQAEAVVSENVLPGTVVVPSNWWHRDFPGGSGPNVLMSQRLTDLGRGAVFTTRATVEPLSPPGAGPEGNHEPPATG